jgi:predicted component of type VI protein secretion system
MYAMTCHAAEYRQLASEYRRLAALLTRTADKKALELFAIGWDKIANNREAMLHSEEQSEPA